MRLLLQRLSGRKLTAVKPERMERMLSKHSLCVLPGLPPLTSSPCLYDERLLQEPSLLVESGQPGVLLEIGSEHYKSILLAKASAARFGEPLASIRPNLDRPDDDRAEITQAVQAFTARRIQQRLEETIEIPPLPETAQKIIKLRVDPDATVDDITGVVETDPALAAQVVSWAASPYYADFFRTENVRGINYVYDLTCYRNKSRCHAHSKAYALSRCGGEGVIETAGGIFFKPRRYYCLYALGLQGGQHAKGRAAQGAACHYRGTAVDIHEVCSRDADIARFHVLGCFRKARVYVFRFAFDQHKGVSAFRLFIGCRCAERIYSPADAQRCAA